MSKNVERYTIVLEQHEVDSIWDGFIADIKEYIAEHFVRNGSMTKEEVKDKVSVDFPFVSFQTIDNQITVTGIEADVDVSLD